jgi:hypothetical protein
VVATAHSYSTLHRFLPCTFSSKFNWTGLGRPNELSSGEEEVDLERKPSSPE